MSELTIGEVYRAQMVLKDVARHPKIIGPTTLSDSCRIYLKPENLQHTGSFKLRGAYYKISQLSEDCVRMFSIFASSSVPYFCASVSASPGMSV